MGIDLTLPLRWLCYIFFRVFVLIECRFCTSAKTGINNLYESFYLNTFQYSVRKRTIKCLLIGSSDQRLLNFKFSPMLMMTQHTKKYSAILC